MARARRRDSGADVPEEEVSRSQRKRESTAMQKLGERLTRIGEARLRTLDLPPNLMAAVLEWHGLPTHEARRRQLQFIGRLMREADVDAVSEAVDALDAPHRVSTEAFHELEVLRDRLMEEGPVVVDEILALWPHADRQQLRQMVRNAQAERAAGKPPRNFRALFRLLRDISEAAPAAGGVMPDGGR